MKKIKGVLTVFMFFYSCAYGQQNNFIAEGIKLHDKGDYEGAISFYKKALQSDQNSVHANYEMASTYLAMKDYANALKFADKVIARNQDYVDQAYILKGSALDLTGNPLEAINTYKLALKKYSKNHSLYYNLGLTYFNLKQYNDAEDVLIRSLKLNQLHASSHFLLGLTMARQGKRVKSLLALYNFLLLEPKSKRSATALQVLEDQWTKAGNKTPPSRGDADEFLTATAMLDVLQSSINNEANKNKPAIVLFAENTNIIFTILGEEKKGKKGFWWDFYVDYFYTLAGNNHTGALCYYINQSKGDVYDVWLKDNVSKMEALSEWYTKYLHKF